VHTRKLSPFAATRWSAGLAVLAGAALAAAGCGNNTTAPPASASASGASNAASKQAPAASASKIIAEAGKATGASFCGSKPITLGIQDGFGVNGWSKSSMAAVRSEAAKCKNVKQVVQVGQGDLQRTISQVNGMVAQGITALAIIPDFGKSELPAIRAATQAGVKVATWAADPGGTAGTDFLSYSDYNERAAGQSLAEWVAGAIHDKGNVVFLGGPAGNPVSTATLAGIHDGLAKHPNVKLLTGYTTWPVTNWDAAQVQKTMAALLAKYPKIDAVIDDADGFDGLGVPRAFTSAGRKLVPYATFENNQLACDYYTLKKTNPNYELATMSTRNWIGRIAARKVIAAAEGIPNTEPDIYTLPFYEDTLHGKKPNCQRSLPPDAFVSASLTASELSTYGKTN
jgi:ribose transport system substrate-binding protein